MGMDRMIFVTGFARGGTSWLRDCIGSHPDIQILPRERTIFRDGRAPEEIRNYFNEEVSAANLSFDKHVVNKAPANAPSFGEAARNFPESKFIFIIRDPRDVFVSHKRGEKAWMKGINSTVTGCMAKTQKYFSGWTDAEGLHNVHLVRYEDLHQDFPNTIKEIFEFIGLPCQPKVLKQIYEGNDFRSQTSRKNKEDRAAAKRKGVIGDWAIHLSNGERRWYRKDAYWSKFMDKYGYDWKELTYPAIVKAMKEADCNFLSEDDLLARHFDTDRVNVILFHDIDDLNWKNSFASIRDTARVEAEIGAPGIYNFLPLDDTRYWKSRTSNVIRLIHEIQKINPQAVAALHFNACEKFFPAALPDYGDEIPDLSKAIEYLHTQIDTYEKHGVKFRTATAHGYGRGKKRPNNRDTEIFTPTLAERGIQMFDTAIRPELYEKAAYHCAISDVGGVIQPRGMIDSTPITDPDCYHKMPKGTVVRFLTHPGNYEANKAAVLSMRHIRIPVSWPEAA